MLRSGTSRLVGRGPEGAGLLLGALHQSSGLARLGVELLAVEARFFGGILWAGLRAGEEYGGILN